MYFSKIKKITFGKNIAFQIKDFKHIKLIINQLYQLIDTNTIKYVRVTNKSDLAYIKQNNYYVTPQFYGKESLMFFCKINDTFYNVLIFKQDLRKNILDINYNYLHIYKIKINVPKHLYKGTLFDGILFNKNNITHFVINDLLVHNGKVTDDTISNKQNITNTLINSFQKNKFFNITINKFFTITQIKELYYDKIKQSAYDINGLVFIDPAKNNTVFNLYNNDVHSQSITGVFNMKKYLLTDVYILECYDNDDNEDNQLKKWGVARIPNLKQSLYYQQIFKNNDNITVKCIYNLRFNKWEPTQIMKNQNIKYSLFNTLKNQIQQII
jgi:hypothetical protein